VITRFRVLDALISQIYFWNQILHVSDGSSVHHQKFFAVHTTMVYVIQVHDARSPERQKKKIVFVYLVHREFFLGAGLSLSNKKQIKATY